jgi:hypothetical protein
MKATEESKELYQIANDELSLINRTLESSDNESIPFIICESVKECMYNFLKCYLLMKNEKPSASFSIGALVKECATIDERFKQIDLRCINCRDINLESNDDEFCTSVEQIKACTTITNGIKKIVDEEIEKITTL